MIGFVKVYWLELALFAVSLVGVLVAWPFLPEQVPVLWNLPTRPAPKWSLPLLTIMQLPGACLVRFGLHLYFAKYPAVALTFGSLERLVPPLFSVALILCQLSSVLGAFGLFFPVLYVLLGELVFLVLLCVCLAAKQWTKRCRLKSSLRCKKE